MTKHDKPLSEHDKKVLQDLAEIEKHGMPKEEKPAIHINVGAIARAASGPSLGEAMRDASGVGGMPATSPPIIDDPNSALPHGYEGPLRPPADDGDKPKPGTPRIEP